MPWEIRFHKPEAAPKVSHLGHCNSCCPTVSTAMGTQILQQMSVFRFYLQSGWYQIYQNLFQLGWIIIKCLWNLGKQIKAKWKNALILERKCGQWPKVNKSALWFLLLLLQWTKQNKQRAAWPTWRQFTSNSNIYWWWAPNTGIPKKEADFIPWSFMRNYNKRVNIKTHQSQKLLQTDTLFSGSQSRSLYTARQLSWDCKHN